MNRLAAAPDKNPEEEAFLEQMNDALEAFEESGYIDAPERYPTVHVIGVPRSGTTLATQLLAAHLDIGYINHLIAAFWKAPSVGIRLSRKLLGTAAPSSYASRFGRTAGVGEPHEFGYFWRRLLGYHDLSDRGEAFAETIDWDRVRRVLVNMTIAWDRPIVFKSFWLSMHIRRIQAVLPRTCFIRIRRDPVDNALSLNRMRCEVHGSSDQWASMKPKEYAWLTQEPVPMQLAGQVFFLEQMIDRHIAAAGGSNILEVSYAALCAQPAAFLSDVCALLRANGVHVDVRSLPERPFEPSEPTRSADPELIASIRTALDTLRDQAPAATRQ